MKLFKPVIKIQAPDGSIHDSQELAEKAYKNNKLSKLYWTESNNARHGLDTVKFIVDNWDKLVEIMEGDE